MRNITKCIVSLLLITGLVPVLNADSIFDFSGDAVGTVTPFSDANNGLTASYSAFNGATPQPNGFIVWTNPFVNFGGGNNLYETAQVPGYPDQSNLTLQILFSSPVNAVTFPFALNAPAGSTLTLTAFSGGTQIGQLVSAPSIESPDNGYSYGTLAFNPGQTFDELQLGNAFEFALDDLATTNVTPVSGVPEPASVALMFLGLAGILAYARRHLHNEAA
ncbi:MAG TPA: PEP-CTERM sorting domain-containing protein [Bryobacteraceae bacterium]|nr:PEP-CTERM sorting domain-containing protein [Bryobacteraceae bacterium]